MTWIWQQSEWPNFTYDSSKLAEIEYKYQQNSNFLLGAYQHISEESKTELKLSILVDEAIKTSSIEGEVLDRDSIQYSLQAHLGLIETTSHRLPARESGLALMMVELYNEFATMLSNKMICSWHLELMSYRYDLENIGSYRNSSLPMQIVSGSGNKLKLHYEAPPSAEINKEMDNFIIWFNQLHKPDNKEFAIAKAGLTHLYFECIHPFDDGNGRIGRALVDKSLATSLGAPTVIAISKIIEKNKKKYYQHLGFNNNNLDATNWLIYFGNIILQAQEYTKLMIEFINFKSKLLDKFNDQLNTRQQKLLDRIFKTGLDGFKGGVSIENYISITKTSRATATRDLKKLTELGILEVTGKLKSTRYHLIFKKV